MIAEKEIHLRDYLRVVRKRKWAIVSFFVLTVLIVVIATFTKTPEYYAGTKVMIERNTAGALTSTYSYTPYDPEFIETQNQLIMSSSVVEKAVEALDPEKLYAVMFPEKQEKPSYLSMVSAWVKDQVTAIKTMMGIDALLAGDAVSGVENPMPDVYAVPPTKADILASVVKKNISVTPVQNSRILQIGFLSKNPAVAMNVANALSQAYTDELIDMQMSVSGYSIGWMTQKAEVQRKKLEESEKKLHQYKKDHDIVTIEDRVTVLPERMSDISRQLTAAETTRKELSAIYNQVRNVKKENLETIPAVAESVSVEFINQKILAAEQKISELSKKYGAKHPRMISAQNELKGLKDSKYEELEKVVQTIRNEFQLAQAHELSLKAALDTTRFEAEQLGEKSIQLGMLQRKVDTNRYLYDALVKKMEERDITERNQSVNVWVIEEAKLPVNPAKPNKKRNILLGIILGLFGGIGLAFFFEYLDNTIKTPEDVEEKFDVPVITTIDLVKGKKPDLVQDMMEDSTSLMAESFKGMRTAIFLSAADTPPKSLIITSVTPGEGKSSVTACLAISIAQAGKKVLLIDADMRRPTQYRHFLLDNSAGLSSYLAGVSDLETSMHQSVLENLDIMTSGPVPPNPSELLSSKNLSLLLSDAVNTYDMVLVDTPPLASVTDPVILSRQVAGVILVTWAGKTTHEMLGKGIKQLKEVDAPMTGVVLNYFNARKSGYYYNYGDYYYASTS
ncbi:MAG: polysaccharide biosynthesis tyrosine autokinase [Desulfobacteraceae bacterium]|nr:polysaccharide biosynthesis tyrosine autokinase [Desulfobacteraceae bacterium]